MTTLYKLTDHTMQTYNGYQWALDETRTFPGTGDLCGPGWCHAYTHPLLAVLLNPIHANFPEMRLFEAEGIIGRMDCGLKVGCSALTLTKELPIPLVTTEHRVYFAILCALAISSDPAFHRWAEQWLDGTNRSEAAAEAAWAAAGAAKWAAKAAAQAAAAEAAVGAAGAAEAAAGAVADINLIEIAEAACAELLL